MIRGCDYCFSVFEESYYSWCIFKNDKDETSTSLCSICASEILYSQKILKEIDAP